jgi:septal ring factor EnvC (AmiA/AmiB activator)
VSGARRVAATFLLLGSIPAASGSSSRDDPAPEDRLRRAREEIVRLTRELEDLSRREHGILGEIETLDAKVRLRAAEIEEIEAGKERVEAGLRVREERLAGLSREQRNRERWLRFRIRELYKAGPFGFAGALFGGGGAAAVWEGVRTAAATAERDARTLREWRQVRAELRTEIRALESERAVLDGLLAEGRSATARLEAERRSRAAALERIRTDRERRRGAVAELEAAARDLSRLAAGNAPAGAVATLDVRRFRGLLDWPLEGARVAAGYGDRMHPRFGTVVPHPGLDLETAPGSTFRAIFDGRVAFAASLRGYGLTALVDHGGGVVSVYAQASALLVAPGQEVVRGQPLGRVGDPASRGAAGIYFELREEGQAVDPMRWLRPR